MEALDADLVDGDPRAVSPWYIVCALQQGEIFILGLGYDPLAESSIRAALLQTLWTDEAQHGALLLEELGLLGGSYRADVVLCGATLAGFEIKSAQDSLVRFVHQIRAYGAVFDTATAVVTLNHLRGVLEVLPEWWGLTLATATNGRTTLVTLREPESNPRPDALALASLLWKEEAWSVLAASQDAVLPNRMSRRALHEALAERLAWDDLRDTVVGAMRLRNDWLPAYSPSLCGG
jgi:hypothetical protein